jgi:hypothetical protein
LLKVQVVPSQSEELTSTLTAGREGEFKDGAGYHTELPLDLLPQALHFLGTEHSVPNPLIIILARDRGDWV